MPPRTQRRDFIASMGDPLNKAMQEDRQNLADELKEVLNSLDQFDQSSIKGMLYRVPIPNGKWDWIQDVFPPFDMSGIMHNLKEEIGGGDYVLKIMAEDKPRKNLWFSIHGPKNSAPLMVNNTGDQNMSLISLLLSQQAEARKDAQSRSEDMMKMFMAMQAQTTAMMTAAMGGREKVTDFLPLLAAMKGDGGGSMKETLDLLVTAKGLFGGEGGDKDDAPGFDADNMVGSLVKMAGPVASAIGRAMGRGQAQPGPHPAALDYTGAEPEPTAPLMMPGPAPAPAIPPPVVPRDTIAGDGYGGRFPVLEAVRDEVVLMFAKGYSPQTAAAAIYDRVVDLGVTEDQLGELVLAFTSSADVLGELAAAGIDLRSRPEWAAAFFEELVAAHNDAAGLDDDDDAAEPDALGSDQHPARPRRGAANP